MCIQNCENRRINSRGLCDVLWLFRADLWLSEHVRLYIQVSVNVNLIKWSLFSVISSIPKFQKCWQSFFSTARNYLTDIESLYGLLTESPEVLDSSDAKILHVTGGTIEFKNVFFEYLENQPILKNVSFTLPSGQTVAIVNKFFELVLKFLFIKWILYIRLDHLEVEKVQSLD